MSYDVHFFDKNNEPIEPIVQVDGKIGDQVYNLNYTSNMRRFFCFGFKSNDGLHCLNGLSGIEVIIKTELFLKGIHDFINDDYDSKPGFETTKALEEAFNAKNGHGDIHTATTFIEEIQEVAKHNPHSTCFVSC